MTPPDFEELRRRRRQELQAREAVAFQEFTPPELLARPQPTSAPLEGGKPSPFDLFVEFLKAGGLPGAAETRIPAPLAGVSEPWPKLPAPVTELASVVSMVIPAFMGAGGIGPLGRMPKIPKVPKKARIAEPIPSPAAEVARGQAEMPIAEPVRPAARPIVQPPVKLLQGDELVALERRIRNRPPSGTAEEVEWAKDTYAILVGEQLGLVRTAQGRIQAGAIGEAQSLLGRVANDSEAAIFGRGRGMSGLTPESVMQVYDSALISRLEKLFGKKFPVGAGRSVTTPVIQPPVGKPTEAVAAEARAAELARGQAEMAVTGAAKEPWQMTAGEFASLDPRVKRSPGGQRYMQARAVHRRLVEQALKEGKPVSPEVLASHQTPKAYGGPQPGELGVPAAKPITEAVRPAAKEPWQMTRDEYVVLARRDREEFGARMTKSALEHELQQVANTHRGVVRNAVESGKPVPPEVLAEYSDLVRPAARPAVQPLVGKPTEAVTDVWKTGMERPFAFDPNSTANQGRFRVLSPDAIQKGSYFTRQSSTPGVSYIMGKDAAGNAVAQAIRFDKSRFTQEQAAQWWQANRTRFGGGAEVPAVEIAQPGPVTARKAVAPAAAGVPPPAQAGAAGGVPPREPPVRPTITGAPEPLPTGQPGKSAQDADAAIGRFSEWLNSPESQNAWDLTVQMRAESLGQRVARLEARAQELVVEGKPVEEALQQAVRETMSGKLPSVTTDLTTEFRDALFAKVYHTLQAEPFEMMSTAEALRNALTGRPVPRVPGVAGSSAFIRLQRVFGDNLVVMEQLVKGQDISVTVEQGLLRSAKKPTGVDQELLDYLNSLPTKPFGQARLGELPHGVPTVPPLASPLSRAESLVATIKATYPDLRDMPIVQREALFQELRATGVSEADLGRLQLELFPEVSPITVTYRPPSPALIGEQVPLGLPGGRPAPSTGETVRQLTPAEQYRLKSYGAAEPKGLTDALKPYEPAIEQAVKVPHLMPAQAQHLIIRSLKEAGWTTIDIASFLKANKASFDFSFWRQQSPLILNHKRDFVGANIEAWRALWSGDAARASWRRIQNDPLYPLYEELGLDFLRPLELPKGAPRYAGVEEFGYLQSDRPIPKYTGKVPWINLSQRAFVTGTNEHNWRIFKGFYRDMLKVNERIASGRVVLKEGEAFSIRKNMRALGKLLEDFSGRAALGPAKELAPALNALLFAPRYALGRLLSPRHMFSGNPYVRKEAWKDAVTFVGGFGSILVLGKELGLWDLELDTRSADYGKGRIGPVRFDFWGGYQQFVRLFAQIVTNSGAAVATGEVYKQDPLAAITRFLRGKSSPLSGMVADFKTGKTYVGDDVDLKSPKQWIDRVSPMVPMDIYDALEGAGPVMAAAVTLLAAVGVGVSTYGKTPASWRKDLEPYFDIPSEAEATFKGLKTREEYREDHPEIDAKLFLTGAVTWVKNEEAGNLAVALMKEYNIKVEDIESLKDKEFETASNATRKVRRDWLRRALGEAMPPEKPKKVPATPAPLAPRPTPDFKKLRRDRAEEVKRQAEATPVGAR